MLIRRQGRPEADGGGGLADPALLIGHRDDPGLACISHHRGLRTEFLRNGARCRAPQRGAVPGPRRVGFHVKHGCSRQSRPRSRPGIGELNTRHPGRARASFRPPPWSTSAPLPPAQVVAGPLQKRSVAADGAGGHAVPAALRLEFFVPGAFNLGLEIELADHELQEGPPLLPRLEQDPVPRAAPPARGRPEAPPRSRHREGGRRPRGAAPPPAHRQCGAPPVLRDSQSTPGCGVRTSAPEAPHREPTGRGCRRSRAAPKDRKSRPWRSSVSSGRASHPATMATAAGVIPGTRSASARVRGRSRANDSATSRDSPGTVCGSNRGGIGMCPSRRTRSRSRSCRAKYPS